MSTKKEEVYQFLRRKARNSIATYSVELSDRTAAEVIRSHRNALAETIAQGLLDDYVFLELADIMEWRRTRVRR